MGYRPLDSSRIASVTCSDSVVPYLPPKAKVFTHLYSWMPGWQLWVQALVLGLRNDVRIGYHPTRRFRRAKEILPVSARPPLYS